MTCTHLSQLLEKEIHDYQKQLQERKAYFDKQTGCDVWRYLVERDFQKRFFGKWAKEEKQIFCKGCLDKDNCYINK